jgi:hypothetical protein
MGWRETESGLVVPDGDEIEVVGGSCAGCGCSDDDPCFDEDDMPCAWADQQHTLCTECC